MKRRKRRLTLLLLIPLMLVVLLQGILPFSMLLVSKVKETMERNAVDIDSFLVENRRVVLQSAMINQWSEVRSEASYLDTALETMLAKQHRDVRAFLADPQLQRDYAQIVFNELLSYLRTGNTCGLFLILSNDKDIHEAQDYIGFFLRDSDPTTRTATDSDLLFERGDKSLARESSIALDSSWFPTFQFLGSGVRKADDFFYTPYQQALNNIDADMVDLGYWAEPFILEDHPLDNHQMITYSIPLCHDGVVYGILGTEISLGYLSSSYLPVRDLDRNQNAGYALAIDHGQGEYTPIAGKGTLFDSIRQKGKSYRLEETDHRELFRVRDSSIGTQGIYSVVSPLSLYSANVPYENTAWALCGFVTEDSIFALGNQLYRSILTTILFCALAGLAFMLLVVRYITAPVYRLMDSVRGGLKGLREFRPSNIQEVDELHQVVQSLTESEISSEHQLMEEKERYRIALESSNDIFFTYRQDAHTLEVVNSNGNDGIWPIREFWDRTISPAVSIADQSLLIALMRGSKTELHAQLLLTVPGLQGGRWSEINGKTVFDQQSGCRTVVGYVRDIHKEKLRELEQENQQKLDPVTGFYRLKQGLAALSEARKQSPAGMLVLLDIYRFSSIVQTHGLTFGDVLLSEAAKLTDSHCRRLCPQSLLIRAGADSFLLWLPGAEADGCRRLLAALQADFSGIIRQSTLELIFCAGLAPAAKEPAEELLQRVRIALSEALQRGCAIVQWEAEQHPAVLCDPFSEIVSQDSVTRMSLASVLLNLFDRSASVSAALDLAACCLAKQFPLADLLVTAFNSDHLSGMVRYCWKDPEMPEGMDSVYHCSEAEYRSMNQAAQLRQLRPMEEAADRASIFRNPADTRQGIFFPMADNGKYSGSIFFVGIAPAVLGNKSQANLLWEIGTIIQNRLNQEHHDQSAQAKSDFLARMSHEIRTPMNGIIGMTEIALQENQSEQVRLDCLKKVRTSSDYLLGLLNDILDMSKIESGKMTLVKEDFDLSNLLDELHPVLDSGFAEKDQTFQTDIQLIHHWFHADALRISQVLINLLGNAIKYSDRGTKTLLTVKETPLDENTSSIYFAVTDQGVGISQEDHQRIFGVFEQLDNATAQRQGSGLGLSICNRLIHMMDSEILLSSELGRGSTFSFTLKLPVALAPQQKTVEAADQVDLTGIRVLVAEDNELNLEIIQVFLEDMGCVVDSACNGRQALEIFQASPEGTYRMIFMDVMMPVMDGLEATYRIRTCGHPDSERIPIIAVSANAFDEDIKRSLSSGMNAHLSKPIEPGKLKRAVQHYARRS